MTSYLLDRHRGVARTQAAKHGLCLIRAAVERVGVTAARRAVDRDSTVDRDTRGVVHDGEI